MVARVPSSAEDLAKVIEYSRLRPETTDTDIIRLCREAKKFGFYAAVVNANKSIQARTQLKGSEIRLVTTVSFPFGCSKLEVKEHETRTAIADGADEVDVVADLGQLAAGNYNYLREEVSSLSRISKESKVTLKVIIETSLLATTQIGKAARTAEEAGADFVKTNTGFGTRGVTTQDIRIIKESTRGRIGIKAAGGIADASEAIKLIRAGATRIGASQGPRIIETFRRLAATE